MSKAKKSASIQIRNVKDKKKTRLKFKDNEGHDGFDITTEVEQKGKVQWRLNTRCKLATITEIKFDDESIFEGGLKYNRTRTKVKGIIKQGVVGDYAYTVGCKMKGNQEVIQDPILRVPPPSDS